MNNPEQIKQLLTPIMVAQHYLGQPEKSGNRLWYKSPFRNERTASFMVDKAFHDFGDGWHGDVIDFVERYYNTDFINAMKILSRDFGLPENEPISREVEQYIKRKREEEQQMKRNLDNWFNSTYNKLCDELHITEKAIKNTAMKNKLVGFWKYLYNRESKLNYLWEIFFDAVDNEQKKLELWRDKEEIEKCLK